MACKIKENKNMAPSARLREEDNSSEDENNRPVERRRGNYRMREQQALRRLKELRAEKEMLEEKHKFLVNELRFLKSLFMEKADEISQIDLPKPVLKALLRDTSSNVLENDLTKPQSSP